MPELIFGYAHRFHKLIFKNIYFEETHMICVDFRMVIVQLYKGWEPLDLQHISKQSSSLTTLLVAIAVAAAAAAEIKRQLSKPSTESAKPIQPSNNDDNLHVALRCHTQWGWTTTMQRMMSRVRFSSFKIRLSVKFTRVCYLCHFFLFKSKFIKSEQNIKHV